MKRIAITAALFALAACSEREPESVEDRAEALEAELQNRADQLEAEAANGVTAAETELKQEYADFGNMAENETEQSETEGE